jgi:RNA polymerase sigma factor (sigma-70 family)
MYESEGVVLIVDDDASMRCSLERLMRSVGLKAKSFGSAQEFLRCCLPEEPACLVLDIRMPGLSGLDLQDRLIITQRNLPIIFITGHGSVPMSVRALKSGAVDFLLKPFDDQELLDAIHKTLERNRLTKQEAAERVSIQQHLDSLTPREHEVLVLVVRGRLNKQIADKLSISEKTVKMHRARVMKKMQARSLAELVRLAGKIESYEQDHRAE